jgi:hypothetical protein
MLGLGLGIQTTVTSIVGGSTPLELSMITEDSLYSIVSEDNNQLITE